MRALACLGLWSAVAAACGDDREVILTIDEGYVAFLGSTHGVLDFSTGLLRSPEGVVIPASEQRAALFWSTDEVRRSCAPDDDEVLALYPLEEAVVHSLPVPRRVVALDDGGWQHSVFGLSAGWPSLRCPICCIIASRTSAPEERRGGCNVGEPSLSPSACRERPAQHCCVSSEGRVLRYLWCETGEIILPTADCR